MNLAERWHSQHRSIKNLTIVLLVDLVMLLGAVFSIPGLQLVWETLSGYLPNIYEPIFLQFIALIRGVNPATVVASGTVMTYCTAFLTLVTIHGLIGCGIGYLFQKMKPTLGWSVVNYLVLILILFLFHLFVVLKTYWFFT